MRRAQSLRTYEEGGPPVCAYPRGKALGPKGVPWELVGQAPGRVPEECYSLWSQLYPHLRRLGGCDG